jgi:hypothetical protein
MMGAGQKIGARKGKGAPARRQLDSWTPHRCVVLAVDTAETSGWSIMIEGALVDCGEVNCLAEPERVAKIVSGAQCWADLESMPLVLVLEAPFAGNMQGQYRGAWRMCAAKVGCRLVVQVQASQWRSRVLGLGFASAPRKLARKAEASRAHYDVMRALGREPGPDEAAAVCIGYWATYAIEVGKKLKRKGAA